MQSTLCSPSRIHQFQFPCKTKETHFLSPILIPKKLNFPLKTLSLRTSSIDHEPIEESVGKGHGPARLPVVVRRDGGVSRYFWDGSSLQLIGVDGGASVLTLDFDGGFGKLLRIFSLAVRNFFIPKQVHEHYMDYVKWKFLHRVFSSALQVLATQAMFRAIGIGYSRSLASAAALNWVFKDGLGRLCRCIYTASLASAFDTNLKRVRFSTSVVFSLSMGVELLTPIFPQYFLLLASIANIAKQISLACYLATGVPFLLTLIFNVHEQSAVHRSFAIADNLGEVSAKAQIQAVCFDNLGLMLAAFLNILFKNNQRLQAGLPFVVYPIFSAIDLYGIYQGLKHVHLQTLTKDRLQIILNMWIEFRDVPSPATVSKEEGIELFWSKGEELWPIRIGCLDPKSQLPKMSMLAMQSLSSDDYHFICMEICERLPRTIRQGILLSLREGASTEDIIMGLLQACYVRKALLSIRGLWDSIMEAGDASDITLKEWFKLIGDSKRRAQGDMCLLNEYLLSRGWAVKNILLSTKEQDRYSFVDN